MYSVTSRIKAIKQPYGGYIRLKDFEKICLNDRQELYLSENIHPSLVGIAVDYLTRFMMGTPLENAFKISLCGAKNLSCNNIGVFSPCEFRSDSEYAYAKKILNEIIGLDSISISHACKLAGYDVCYRKSPLYYRPVQDIRPDELTIHNIFIMVNRCITFWKKYGPILLDGFSFEGGYTTVISSGDGDYLTKDTLWDIKAVRNMSNRGKEYTLQLLIYYIMGMHSIHPEFQTIKRLGIFNPRLNTIYLLDINTISEDIIKEVSTSVIGYK